MRYLYDLKDMLCDELMEITKSGELNLGMIDTIDKLTHSIKSLEVITSKGQSYGRSYENSNRSYGSYGSYDGSYGSYEGYSGRRRDMRGRYSRAEGDMVEKLQMMMDEAPDERIKGAIGKALSEIKG